MNTSPPSAAVSDDKLRLIVASHVRLTGRDLIAPAANLRETLWQAPRVIVAHGTESDPIFFYGNRLALSVFEMDFIAFTQLPSRFSAEPLLRDERERLLQRVGSEGFIDDYAGVRISSSGKRFRIEQATVWNLIDTDGECHGQAATFTQWVPLTPP